MHRNEGIDMAVQIKRIYDGFEDSDGKRLLVDRLWPRGITKEAARLDGWPKALAPSPSLRTWFGHKAENFAQFAALYRAELDASDQAQAAARQVIAQSGTSMVTLLYAAKDARINHAVVLKAWLDEKADQI